MTTLQTFVAYVRARATEAGYPVARHRGRRALATAAGMSYGDLNRTLAGVHCPDPYELERLADALGVPLVTLLRDSGFVRARGTETSR
jgi:DNA-binding phage protein